jgi:tRNA threonylcarbamoyladenosine biosynthesis protein TsaE
MHHPEFTQLDLRLNDEAATAQFALQLAPTLQAGFVIWLEGDLGAGKTTLVRALLRALGYTGMVKSPTYPLVEGHLVSGLHFFHFDFYRFNQPEDYLDAGLHDYFSDTTICLVEWPDKGQPYVPTPDLTLTLAHDDAHAHARSLHISAHSPRGESCLAAVTSLALPPVR